MASQSGVSNLNNFDFFRNLAKFNGTSGSRARRIENENSNFRKWQFQFCNFQLSNNLIMCGTSILEEIQILNSVENFSTRKNRQFCSKIQLRIIFGHEKHFNNAYIRKWSILARKYNTNFVSKFSARKYRNSVTDFWSHLEQSKILHFLSKSLTSKESFLSNCQKLNKNLRVNQNASNFYVTLEQNLEMVTEKPKFGSNIISDHFMVSNMNIMKIKILNFYEISWIFDGFWHFDIL